LLTVLRGSKGVILVRIKVNTKGEVDDVEIVRSTLPMLNDVIRKLILGTWKFEPPMNAGHPARIEYLQPFSFAFN
jgi:TonB family protein